jgi:tRNA threonylcarbamoyladenosine biosynthesis protein TsaE
MTTAFSIDVHDLDQTLAVAASVAGVARAGDVLALTGELGAGKTQFVRGLARGLGLDPAAVSSPTFVLMQEYDPPEPATTASPPVLVHIDAYRLHGPEGLATLGWEGDGEAIRAGAVVAIEWADLVEPALGDDWLAIDLTHARHGRHLRFTAHGQWQHRLAALKHAVHAAMQK